VKYSGHVIDMDRHLTVISCGMQRKYCFMHSMKSNDWRKSMVEIEVKTEKHIEALDLIRDLFKSAMDDEIDPDIFMESLLAFALSYHLQFSDRDFLDEFIENFKQNNLSSGQSGEIICH
jgi:hypothetical protein